MTRHQPLSPAIAWPAVARCFGSSVMMLLRGQVRCPRDNLDRTIRFADGTTGRVYRETAVHRPVAEPCVLVVSFRLRGIRGRGHTLFRWESILNTPLFVGFPGFVSKLWLAHDAHSVYRGLYEWDGSARAEHYARSLWRVLALISERESIDFRVFPGLSRDEVLAEPDVLAEYAASEQDPWWRVVAAG